MISFPSLKKYIFNSEHPMKFIDLASSLYPDSMVVPRNYTFRKGRCEKFLEGNEFPIFYYYLGDGVST